MENLVLDGHGGGSIEIDVCRPCHAFWFDAHESLQLAPGSTLRLFSLIGGETSKARTALATAMRCPRCQVKLVLTNDWQRNTSFKYWRCDNGHGRLITFFDFLREKNFIRALSPVQIEELKRNVQTLSCSNCGAPIDLARASACEHCSTPISMLDLKQIEAMVDQLRKADEASRTIDPMLPVRLAHEKRQVEALFDAMNAGGGSTPEAFGLVEMGLRLISKLV